MIKRSGIGISLLCVCLAAGLSGCQPSPSEDIVTNKNEGALESIINKQEDADTAGPDEESVIKEGEAERDTGKEEQESVSLQESFTLDGDQVTVRVDAAIPVSGTPWPVVRVNPHYITADEAKIFVGVLFEGETAYEPDATLTKAEIQEKILKYKQWCNDRDKLLIQFGDEDTVQEIIDEYQETIEEYEEAYADAPDSEEQTECEWVFHPSEYYMQDTIIENGGETDSSISGTEKLVAVTDSLNGHSAGLYITNRDEEDFLLNMLHFYYEDEDALLAGLEYQEISEDEAREKVDTLLQEAGWEDWKFWSAEDISYEGVCEYKLIYTPVYENCQTIPGPDISLKSEDAYAANLYYSKMIVEICNGIIKSVEITSPMDVTEIENADVETLSFEDIYEKFKSQMQVNYTKENLLELGMDEAKAEITVTDIRLGLFRVKVKDEHNTYRMVPAWIFSGKLGDEDFGYWSVDYLVLNAIDGSVINTELGY